jgi:hypothetical protein
MSVHPVKCNPRPVVCLATVTDVLGIDSDAAMDLVDNGELAFAWNISTPKARCREVRVLAEAVQAYRENRACSVKTVSDAVNCILPKPSSIASLATVRRSVLSRRLGCSAEHLANLTDAREIKLAPVRVSRSESPLLDWQSVFQFLHRRTLGKAAYRAALA